MVAMRSSRWRSALALAASALVASILVSTRSLPSFAGSLPIDGCRTRSSLRTGTSASLHVFGPAAAEVASSQQPNEGQMPFYWAPLSYFGPSQLTSKGVRQDADSGSPSCGSRILYDQGATSVGAWSCTPGGWPVPPRKTTEIMYMLEGEGYFTDTDGTIHCFVPGDTVVLPKGWSGRWDVLKAVHKIWVINKHGVDLPAEDSQRAVVGAPADFDWSKQMTLGKRNADWGNPIHMNVPMWKSGPTNVGSWACTEGGFPGTANRPTTEFFYVMEGLCFLTGTDGVARRVGAGDTVVLPKGWSGRWDILEPIRKMFVVISE